MKKAIIGLGVFLTLLIASSTTMASDSGFAQGLIAGISIGSMESTIKDSTSEQSNQIHFLRETFIREIEPILKDLESKKIEVRKLWSDPYSNPAEVKAKQNEIIDLNSKLKEAAMNFMLDLQKVLTPDQMALIEAFCLRGNVNEADTRSQGKK